MEIIAKPQQKHHQIILQIKNRPQLPHQSHPNQVHIKLKVNFKFNLIILSYIYFKIISNINR